MKKFAMLSLVALLATSCNAQEKRKPEVAQNNDKTLKEEPKGTWEVNKEVDENGNIVSYDSIYSWSSDKNFKDMDIKDRDSLLQSVRSMFNEQLSTDGDQGFSDFFQNDSLLMDRFFSDDFFEHDFGGGIPNLEEMRQRMETMQQQFMEGHRKPLIPAEPEKENSVQ